MEDSNSNIKIQKYFTDCGIMSRRAAELEIKNCSQREKYLIFTLDGRKNFELYYGDRVCVSRASTTAKFIRLKPASFYMTLHEKMSEKDM